MRIARLDLFGFKSFVDRTSIHFGHGISCVVGPNGSGKSNVVDALKWCLGEQSARSLRGSDMSDVIFAGSEDRRPVGFAEVQLTLRTEHEEPFPGDYAALSEVQVGRRLHRTGASEYLINQARVRRKDVVELLMDSGIGNNLYSFIEQGEIDKVITASPEERRRVIDEAAGIGRYKTRRAEATTRLEATATQLDRASDVVDEMRRRLEGLERQVIRAAEYRRVAAMVRQLELQLAVAKAHGLKLERTELREEDHEVRGALEAAEARIEAEARDIRERRAQVGLVEGRVASLRDQLAELDAHVREQEATRRLHDQRRRELEKQVVQSRDDVGHARHDAAVATDEVRELRAASTAMTARLNEITRESEAVLRALSEARDETGRARQALTAADTELQGVAGERQQLETRRASLGARREALEGQLRKSVDALAELREQRAEALVRRDETAARLAPHQAQRRRFAEIVAAAASTHAAAQAQQTTAEEALADARRDREARFAERRAEARAVQERGRQWLAAADADLRAGVAQLEQLWRTRAAEVDRRAAHELETRVAEARAATEADVAQVVARAERRVATATASREAADEAVVEARAALDHLDEQLRRSRSSLAERESQHLAVRARLAVDSSLEQETQLIDRFEAADRVGVVDRLGERALAPVVGEPDRISRAAAQRAGDDRILVWYRPDGTPPPSAFAQWLPDLATALATYGESPGPLAGPGFRIDAEGWVAVGPREDLGALAEQESALAEAIRELREHASTLSNARDVAEAGLSDATVARTTAERTWKSAQDDEAQARAAARAQVSDAERVAVERQREAQEARGRDRNAERDLALAEARRRGETHLDALRAEAERIEADWLARQTSLDSGDFSELEATVQRAREASREALAERDEAQEAVVEQTQGWERVDAEAKAAERELERTDAELTKQEQEHQDLEGEHKEIVAHDAEQARTWAERNERSIELLARVEALRAEVSHAATTEAARSEAVAVVEERRASARTEQAGLVAHLEGAEGRLERATSTIAKAEGRVQQAYEAIEESVRARDEAARFVEEAGENRGAAFDAYETARARLKAARAELGEREEAQRGSLGEAKALARRAEAIAERTRETGTELQVLRERMADRYQIELEELLKELFRARRIELGVPEDVARGLVIGDIVVEPVAPVTLGLDELDEEAPIVARVRSLDRLRARLQTFGTVNIAALEEYRELDLRYSELEAQRVDLEESVRSIQAAIAKLNRECRERFRLAFDQVNEHFQVAYPRLVGGGQARLALTDDEDLLECGVDIFVQPPGKRLQNLQLLSGGEKAMTAIALLIALFRVKPSPFCVLDEVDAPLDEANGARFNEMLREMAAQSQFLVVTHNRKTMECADTLFGVTMAKPGVSRLVSVQL